MGLVALGLMIGAWSGVGYFDGMMATVCFCVTLGV